MPRSVPWPTAECPNTGALAPKPPTRCRATRHDSRMPFGGAGIAPAAPACALSTGSVRPMRRPSPCRQGLAAPGRALPPLPPQRPRDSWAGAHACEVLRVAPIRPALPEPSGGGKTRSGGLGQAASRCPLHRRHAGHARFPKVERGLLREPSIGPAAVLHA